MKKRRDILIVEDDYLQSYVLELHLKSLNYNVIGVAVSGEEAIAITERQKPTLVIMDISLKGEMDGIDTAKIILKSYDISILYISGHLEVYSRSRAEQTNYIDIINKPLCKSKLVDAIDKCIKL
ncbi:MAG: response regulator [Balneolaceae bacterium]|nr:MAG: response regulator [Balneolaceae bacterium]